ncbi:MAG: hypothetical protein ACLSWY_07880, partial [Ruthenibacterium lactatiformans]
KRVFRLFRQAGDSPCLKTIDAEKSPSPPFGALTQETMFSYGNAPFSSRAIPHNSRCRIAPADFFAG